MKTSQKAIQLLKEFEAFCGEPYNDEAGNATIGYGHLMHIGPVTEEEKSIRWTVEQADKQFLSDLISYEEALTKALKIKVNQNQFDSLICWVYNCGVGAMFASSWLKAINRGEYEKVPTFMKLWNKVRNGSRLVPSNGLINRREKEANLFEGKI